MKVEKGFAVEAYIKVNKHLYICPETKHNGEM